MRKTLILRAAAALFCAAAVPTASPAAAADAPPRVVILAPAADAPVVGPTVVAFRFEGVEDGAVREAVVALDGRAAATLVRPPWRTTIDAGAELRPRRLEVRARLADGRALTASRTTRAVPATEVSVRLVTLAVSVVDESGKPIAGLGRDDFDVLDGGRPVAIDHFETAPAPLAVALVVDTSVSMEGDKLDAARRAGEKFLAALEPRDRALLVAFSDDVRIEAPLGPPPEALPRLAALTAGGGTALYDAVHRGAAELAAAPEGFRRVVVLLSDGRDEAASGLEPGSFHTLDEAVRKAHEVDALIYALGMGPLLKTETDFTGRFTTADVLRRLARTTGGQFVAVAKAGRLGAAFREVQDELRRQYTIAYRPPAPRPGETFRTIEVRVRRAGATARTREGYFVGQ